MYVGQPGLCSHFADLGLDIADFDLRGDYEISVPTRIDSELLSLNIKPLLDRVILFTCIAVARYKFNSEEFLKTVACFLYLNILCTEEVNYFFTSFYQIIAKPQPSLGLQLPNCGPFGMMSLRRRVLPVLCSPWHLPVASPSFSFSAPPSSGVCPLYSFCTPHSVATEPYPSTGPKT